MICNPHNTTRVVDGCRCKTCSRNKRNNLPTKTKKYFTDCRQVVSSNVKKVYWDRDTKEMYVEFLNGTKAGYAGVPEFTYRTLINASSVGSYYARQIRKIYRGIDGNVDLVPRVYEAADLAPVSVSDIASAYKSERDADKVLSLTPRLDGTEAQPVSAVVEGHPDTLDMKRFSVVVEKVVRDSFEVSAKTMEDAVRSLDVDGKVVSVTWIARA